MPSKFTVPLLLEYAGSVAQKLMVEPALEIVTTENLSAGNEKTPETALIGCSGLETIILIGKVELSEKLPELGAIDKLAAEAVLKPTPKKQIKIKADQKKSNLLTFIIA